MSKTRTITKSLRLEEKTHLAAKARATKTGHASFSSYVRSLIAKDAARVARNK